MAVGAALAARIQGSNRRVFIVMSDAECNEGAVWEGVMFAAHRQLSNLVVIVDLNGQQAFGYTRDIINLSPMSERWRAFGWDVHDVDGHDEASLKARLQEIDFAVGAPHVLIAHTIFGKGVSFMENQVKWHYWPMSDSEYMQAVEEITSP